jgi:deazaflavin-dependent oxidoreductase (nitroreductase family)
MPLPRQAARFNRAVTNRFFAPLAGRVPPWVLVEHTGRRSRRTYRTVVWAFPRRGDLVIALTYGPGADWVRNATAAGRCRVMWRGRWASYTTELVRGPAALRLLPAALRPLLAASGLEHALHLHRDPG